MAKKFNRNQKPFSRDGRPPRSSSPGFRKETKPFPRQSGLELFDAACESCGKDTQVPFRPTGNKPVYCRNCFKGGNAESPPRQERGNNDLAEIHRKLDKIMRALKID